MRSLLFIIVCFMGLQPVFAQLKATVTCPTFVVDVLDGNVNKLRPKSTLGEFKKMFPCFTDVVEAADSGKCAGVFYKDQDIYFFSDRNYFEIGENFKGKLSVPIMGAPRNSLFKYLGYPKMKDQSWEAYQTEYGTLVVYFNKAGNINKLQISSRTTETMKLCD